MQPHSALRFRRYRTVDIVSGVSRVAPFKYAEEATVIEVRVLGVQASGDVHPKAGLRRVSIKLQFNRNPVIGDKFSSRHGQKVATAFPRLYPLLIPATFCRAGHCVHFVPARQYAVHCGGHSA